jgi:hypothetical protein
VRRRPTASRKPKKRLANPTHLKRGDAPKAARRRNSSKQTDLARLTRELGEALEQQAATTEILRVISSSPTDLKRVFAVVAASATRLCDASDATIHQVDGAVLRLVAHHGPIRVPGSLPMMRGAGDGREGAKSDGSSRLRLLIHAAFHERMPLQEVDGRVFLLGVIPENHIRA